jgi:hypothetical protein
MPSVVHFCQFFRAGELGFQKRRIKKDIFRCDAPMMEEPPVTLGTVKYKNRDGTVSTPFTPYTPLYPLYPVPPVSLVFPWAPCVPCANLSLQKWWYSLYKLNTPYTPNTPNTYFIPIHSNFPPQTPHTTHHTPHTTHHTPHTTHHPEHASIPHRRAPQRLHAVRHPPLHQLHGGALQRHHVQRAVHQ